MIKKHELDEVASAVRRILTEDGLMDTYELWEKLKEVGIHYTYRTILKKLQLIEEQNIWLSSYFSNGYVWYINNPCGLSNHEDILAAILIDEYQTAWNNWLKASADSEDRFIYSSQIEVLEHILNRLTNIGIKIEEWNNEDRSNE